MSKDNYMNEIAKIGKEEAEFGTSANRIILGFASFVCFMVGVYIIDTNLEKLTSDYMILSSATIVFMVSVFLAIGAWRSHIVHTKLKNIND